MRPWAPAGLVASVGVVFVFAASALSPVLLLSIWWSRLTARGAVAESRKRGTPRAELAQLEGELALRRGERADAAKAFAEARSLQPSATLPATLAVLYGGGDVDPAWLRERIAATRIALASDPWPASRLELALLLQASGDRGGAIAAIADAVDKGWRDAAYLRASPLFAPLADDPAFASLLAAIARRVAAERERVESAPWCPTVPRSESLPCRRR